jgi:hypothetical protein
MPMSSQEVTVELSEDDQFVEEVVAQFDEENTLSNSGFSKYLKKAFKLIQNDGKIRDFCDLLDKSVNMHMINVSTKLKASMKQNTTIATNSADVTTLITMTAVERKQLKQLTRNYKDRALASIKTIGTKVLNFLRVLVNEQFEFEGSTDYLELLIAQPDMKNEILAFRGWVKANPLSLQKSLIMDSVYLEVLSNPKMGLTSKKDDIVPLIEGFLEVDEGIWVENDTENNVKTYLKEKKSNFTTNQTEVFQKLVKFVKSEQDSLSVDNKSLEPAITMTSEPEKRIRNLTKRLSDVVKYDNKKRNATKRRKRNQTLSEAVEEVVLVSDDESEGARKETSSEVSENETDGPTKASKKSKDNRSKAKPIRVLESTPNLSTGLTNILRNNSQVGKNADNEVIPQVTESTPKNREIGSGATTRRKAIIKNKEKAQSIRSEDDVGEDDDEAMEITQEEKSSGEEDVGDVLESTPNLSTGLTNILQDNSQREKTNDEITQEEKSDGSRVMNTRSASSNEGVPESTPLNREIGSEVIEVSEASNGATTTIRGFQSIRRIDDVGEDDDEAMEITQEGNYIDYSFHII